MKCEIRNPSSPGSALLLVVFLSGCFLVLSAAFEPAQANPLKSPRRTINQYVVDLNPLFRWWTNRAGARPLEAWVHITGQIVGTNAWGWVLHAHIGESGRANPRLSEHSSRSD